MLYSHKYYEDIDILIIISISMTICLNVKEEYDFDRLPTASYILDLRREGLSYFRFKSPRSSAFRCDNIFITEHFTYYFTHYLLTTYFVRSFRHICSMVIFSSLARNNYQFS